MPEFPTQHDEDVRAFIDRQPRHLTFSEVAAACWKRFGPERAWSRSEIADYWHQAHQPHTGPVSMLERDPEVRGFLEDRLGRITLDQAVKQCQDAFGNSRTPSRSTVHKFWSRIRSRKN